MGFNGQLFHVCFSHSSRMHILTFDRELKYIRTNLKGLLKVNHHQVWGPPTHDAFLSKSMATLEECFKRMQVRMSISRIPLGPNTRQGTLVGDIHSRIHRRDQGFSCLYNLLFT